MDQPQQQNPPLADPASVPEPGIAEPPEPPDWLERTKQCRAEEWALACDLLAVGRRLLMRHLAQMHSSTSLTQIERILRLAAKLARVSTEVAQNPNGETECRECCRARLQMDADLERIYGEAAQKRRAAEQAAEEELSTLKTNAQPPIEPPPRQ